MTEEPTIVATMRDCIDDCWWYQLSDGTVVKGESGRARVPAGLPLNKRIQWGADRMFERL